MSVINFPVLYIPDPNVGRPLFNGQIYVGEPDLDPEIAANQKQLNVVQEDGTLVPVGQPFTLSPGGVPVYNGSTVRLDVDGNYSFKILSSNGAQAYYIHNVFEGEPVTEDSLLGLAVTAVDDYAELRGLDTTLYADNNQVSIAYRSTEFDSGGGKFFWDSSDLSTEVTADTLSGIYVAPDSDVTGASGAWVRVDQYVLTPEMFGSTDSDTDDNAAALQAVATAAENKTLMFLRPQYSTSVQIDFPDNVHIQCAPGGTIIDGTQITDSGDAPESAVLHFGDDTLTALPALNADVDEGDVAIEFASAHGLAKGDYFCIYNATSGSWCGFRNSYHAGEWCQVASVTDTTNIVVSQPLYDDYASADVTNYKLTPYRYSFTGSLKVNVDSGAIAGLRGIRMDNVVDTDISGLSSYVHQGHAAINLRKCINVCGVGVTALQNGSSGNTSDYGLLIGNCQGIVLTGNFSADRHGVSQGGSNENGAVVNRGNIIDGVIATNGDNGSVLAADWHGNCEYCEYRGLINGGVNYAGDNNKVSAKILANSKGLLAYGSELLGFNFDFDGCSFVSYNDVSSASRGAFDLGGNSTDALTSDTARGGVLSLRNTKWKVPATTNSVIKIVNRGATGSDYLIDLDGAEFTETNASLTAIANISANSGDNFAKYKGDIGLDRDQAYSISDVDNITSFELRGSYGFTGDTGVNSITQAVTFDREYPDTPFITLGQVDQTTGGGDRIYAVAKNATDAGFDLILYTADATNFGGTGTATVNWSAKL